MRFSRSKSDGQQSSQSGCVYQAGLVVKVDAHTSYPILRHHSIISGIAVLFMSLPDFLIASTIEKLLCNVLRAATASYNKGQLRHTHQGEAVAGSLHMCGLPFFRLCWTDAWSGREICGGRGTRDVGRGMIFSASAHAHLCFWRSWTNCPMSDVKLTVGLSQHARQRQPEEDRSRYDTIKSFQVLYVMHENSISLKKSKYDSGDIGHQRCQAQASCQKKGPFIRSLGIKSVSFISFILLSFHKPKTMPNQVQYIRL